MEPGESDSGIGDGAERKKNGVKLLAGLTVAAIAAGWYKRFLWSPLKSRKISFH